VRNKFVGIYGIFLVLVVGIHLEGIRFLKLGRTITGARDVIEDFKLLDQELQGPEDDNVRGKSSFTVSSLPICGAGSKDSDNYSTDCIP
jgi:hypothetical protein